MKKYRKNKIDELEKSEKLGPRVREAVREQIFSQLGVIIYSTLFVTDMTAYKKKKTNKKQKQKSSKQLQSRQLNCI